MVSINLILCFQQIFSLHKMTTELAFKGKRVLVSILSSSQNYGTLDKTHFLRFLISPFLLYGSELWGLDIGENVEKVQYYLCKRFFNVSF